MFSKLKPHSAVQRTGLPWLPTVPSHWRMVRAKEVLHPVDIRSASGEETLLTVSSAKGVVPRASANVTMFQAASYAGHKLCWPGDLVINSLWAWGRGLGVSQHHGIVSTAYGVYRPRDTRSLNATFLHELVRSTPFHWELQVRSKGVWISRLQLTDDSFLRAPLSLPPGEEQAAIVRYLSHANRRIDQAIAAKRKLIRLLEEQKQVIVNQAVTRGLDVNASLKESGVLWLREIPTHWSVWPIGRLARVGNGSTPARSNPQYWDAGHFPWLNSSSVNQGIVTAAGQFVTATALSECHLPIVPPGSVLIAITGQGKTRGTAAVLELEATINQHIAFLTPNTRTIRAPFLKATLDAAYAELRRISDDSGSTKGALTCGDLKAFRVPVPPLAEQQQILDFVHHETQQMDAAIVRAAHEIDLLREFRTRLTSDVVTGQVDVREIAASLPDVSLDALAESVDGSVDDELDELAEEFAEDAALV